MVFFLRIFFGIKRVTNHGTFSFKFLYFLAIFRDARFFGRMYRFGNDYDCRIILIGIYCRVAYIYI